MNDRAMWAVEEGFKTRWEEGGGGGGWYPNYGCS